MSQTAPYEQHHYIGEFADDASALAQIRADLWDSSGNGTGDPRTGMAYFNTTDYTLRVYSDEGSIGGGSWEILLAPLHHAALRQLIHFIDNGPAEGFASGAYRENTGMVFPTAITWYDSNLPGKKKIVEKLITWTGPLATTIQWKMYDANEVLLATVTDTISYSGVFETSRTRSIA